MFSGMFLELEPKINLLKTNWDKENSRQLNSFCTTLRVIKGKTVNYKSRVIIQCPGQDVELIKEVCDSTTERFFVHQVLELNNMSVFLLFNKLIYTYIYIDSDSFTYLRLFLLIEFKKNTFLFQAYFEQLTTALWNQDRLIKKKSV